VTLTLNRPDRLNAVSLSLYQQLISALHSCQSDPAVRVIVLTGAGKAFCVGADLKAHDQAEPTAQQRRTYVRTGQLAHRVMQRYAYSRVLNDLKRKGYQIGKEEKQKDGSIRLVAQRWR